MSTVRFETDDNRIEVTDIVGTYEKVSNYGFVRADVVKLGCDVYIPAGHDMGAVSGQKVAVHIDCQGGFGRKPQGSVTRILGYKEAPGMDVLCVTEALGIDTAFPDDVLELANSVNRPIPQTEIYNRLDLRDMTMVTIDGDDSKDFDDAVSLTKENNVYKLGVHIADVSYYVGEDTALDREARKRGTSIYLPDMVIPMLPYVLSNGICSLNEGEDRLALSCLMTIDFNGNLVDHEIRETVIRSDRRMTYADVNDIIRLRNPETTEKYADLSQMFFDMYELSQIIRKARRKRGSIDFDLPETKVILAEDGSVADILPYEQNSATKLIEDFMLMANETVAGEYFNRQIPFVYRVHEKPSPEKMKDLIQLVRQLGYNLKGNVYDIHPKEIQKLLASFSGTDHEGIISRIALRSMQQARYSTENDGHFGLASKNYCHFTSPIRRYPDLLVHRIIKECIHNQLNDARILHYETILDTCAKQSSDLERRAVEAERAVLKRKKAAYMAGRIGEYDTGLISGVTSYGLYVELKNTCEGLIPLRSLEDDYYEYDRQNFLIYGRKRGKEYRLGDPITVMVRYVDVDQGQVDFKAVGKHIKRKAPERQNREKTIQRINRKSKAKNRRQKR